VAIYCVCLDTNILSDLARRIEAGESPKWWADLRGLVEGGRVTLLVPEITLLELETVIRDTDDKIAREITQLPSKVSDRSLKQHLKDSFKDWRTKIVQGWKAEAKKIEKILRAKPENVIEYTAEIAHRVKRRLIAGNHPRPPLDDSTDPNSPYKKWLREQDCGIIESLIVWFDGKKLDDYTLAFGTADGEKGDGGFGSVEDGNGSLDKKKFEKGVGILDETFADGLPLSQLFFRDMEKLVKFVEKEETVKTLTPEEQAVVHELKLQQEATAQVLKPVVARMEMPLGWSQEPNGVIRAANGNVITGHRVVQGFSLGGFQFGPYLVAGPQSESSGDDQPFFDTNSGLPPSASPDVPAPGLQTFDASNLGDDPPKPEAEKQP